MSKQRELKFRVWDTFNERMVVEPYRFEPAVEHNRIEGDQRFDAPYIYYEDWQDERDGIQRPCVVMQYTGLKDRNGREIFEGDVVKFNMGGEEFKRPVSWNPQGFWTIRWQDGLNTGPLRGTYEVVGNIYENTEMTAR